MTYNGYANEDSYLFDVVWSNSRPLYEAIKSHTEAMRPHWEVMSDQTLGRNVKDAISAMINDGGWGWRSCPDEFVAVRTESVRLLDGIDIRRVDEAEFGANIRSAMGVEDTPDFSSLELPEDDEPGISEDWKAGYRTGIRDACAVIQARRYPSANDRNSTDGYRGAFKRAVAELENNF